MNLKKQCSNCEFNFGGTCAGGDGNTHIYGATISDEADSCSGWGASLECFTEITETAPWYIKQPYDSMRIDYSTFVELLEADNRGNAINVNIYDAIKYFFKISLVDLAVMLNVSFNVIYRAKTHTTPEKRQVDFSKLLGIPQKFFQSFSTHEFNELENCKTTFFAKNDISNISTSMPEWKQKIAIEIVTILRCPIHIAKEISRVDFLQWSSSTPSSSLSRSENILLEFIRTLSKKRGKNLSRLEYSLDNGGHVRVSIL